MFNPIPSSEANPLAPVDVAHPPLMIGVAAFLKRPARGAPPCFWRMGRFVRFGVSPATGRTHPRSTPCRHHMASPPHQWPRHTICMRWVAWLCDARLGGGCVGVVWGGFLCGRVGGGTTSKTNLVCLFLVTGRPPPGILRRATLLASEGWRGWTRIRRRCQIEGYFKGGGRVLWLGWWLDHHSVKPSFDPQQYLDPGTTRVLATSWETPGKRNLFYFELWGLLWALKPDPSLNRVMGRATALGGRKSRN